MTQGESSQFVRRAGQKPGVVLPAGMISMTADGIIRVRLAGIRLMPMFGPRPE
jgi:hypothetical protein